MQERTTGTRDEIGVSGSPDGPGAELGTSVEITTKTGIVQNVTVIGNIDCSIPRSGCLMEYERKCAEVVPYPGSGDGCGPNGIYETRGEPPEAAENVELRESCWDLSNYGGLVKASGVESIFRNDNTAGLIAANPTLEGMCGEGASPDALQNGVRVCLNPKTDNICQIEEI